MFLNYCFEVMCIEYYVIAGLAEWPSADRLHAAAKSLAAKYLRDQMVVRANGCTAKRHRGELAVQQKNAVKRPSTRKT